MNPVAKVPSYPSKYFVPSGFPCNHGQRHKVAHCGKVEGEEVDLGESFDFIGSDDQMMRSVESFYLQMKHDL